MIYLVVETLDFCDVKAHIADMKRALTFLGRTLGVYAGFCIVLLGWPIAGLAAGIYGAIQGDFGPLAAIFILFFTPGLAFAISEDMEDRGLGGFL